MRETSRKSEYAQTQLNPPSSQPVMWRPTSFISGSLLLHGRSPWTWLTNAFRSGASKANKSSHDADYKAILDIFLTDLLTVLYRPEWPAAAIYLRVISRLMVRCCFQLFRLPGFPTPHCPHCNVRGKTDKAAHRN